MAIIHSRLSRKLTFETCEPRRLLAAEQVTSFGTPIASNPTELRQSILGDGFVRFVGEPSRDQEQVYVTDGTSEGTRPVGESQQNRFERRRGTTQSFISSGGRFNVVDRSIRVDVWFHPNDGTPHLVTSLNHDTNVVFHQDQIYALERTGDGTDLVIVAQDSFRRFNVSLPNATTLVVNDSNVFIQADGFSNGAIRKQAIWRITNDAQSFEFVPGSENAKELSAVGSQLFFLRDNVVSVVRNGEVSDLLQVEQSEDRTTVVHLTPSQYGVYLTQTASNELWFIDGTDATTERVQTEVRTTTSLSKVVTLNDASYFLLENKNSDVELWKHHPDRGHEMVRLIPDGRERVLHAMAGRLHFTGQNSHYWTSDGTAEGTRRFDVQWHSNEIAQLNESTVVFSGSRDGQNIEPWRSDGTEQGTQQIVELNPRTEDAEFVASGEYVNQVGDRPIDFVKLNEQLYFAEKSRVFKLSSYSASPKLVHDFATPRRPIEILKVVGADNTLFVFTMSLNATQLWAFRNDTAAVKVWEDPTTNFDPLEEVFVVDNHLFFQSGRSRSEIWRSDGTTDGTSRIIDNLPTRRSPVSSFVARNEDEILFTIENQVYRLDTNTKTATLFTSMQDDAALHDLNGDFVLTTRNGVWSADGIPGDQISMFEGTIRAGKTLNNLLFFVHPVRIPSPNGRFESEDQLWRTDGTDVGTFQIDVGDFSPVEMNAVGNKMYYRTGQDMRISDGSVEGTKIIQEMANNPVKRGGQFVGLGDRVYFDQDLGKTSGVWSTDGTSEGTRFEGVGSAGSNGWLSSMIEFDGRLFYVAEGVNQGLELWRFTPEPPVQGDVDGDRVVDRDDFRILQDNFGTNVASQKDGDLNGDNVVDFRDFLILSQAWKDNT